MLLIDTHAHVNFSAYKGDAEDVIKSSLDKNVWMVLVGSEYRTSQRALEYANKYEKGVYAAVGLHPIHLDKGLAEDSDQDYSFQTKGETFYYDNYEKLAKFEKVVAIGEIGLDYYHIDQDNLDQAKARQKEVFLEQLRLARNLDLPVIIHCRQAHLDMLDIIKDFKQKNKNLFQSNKPWGVMHCFSGDEEIAWQYFSLGLIISFTGIITFSKQWDDLIRKVPFEKFMIETDCPYLAPEPFRGKRNEPILVKYVADRIAEIKNLSIDRVAEITSKNAKNLFGI